jgi:hypothetical protein
VTTRRDFLFAAGAGALVPLLRPFGSTAFAAGNTPTRIVFVYTPNGVVEKNWWPSGSDLTERPILKPLESHKQDMVLFRGLGYSGFNTPHSMGTMKSLTSRDAFVANVPKGRGVMWAPSLDEVLSKSVGKNNVRPVLRIGSHWGNNRGWLMFDETGTPLAPIGKVDELFAYAFGGSTGNLPMDPGTSVPSADTARLNALRESRKSVLDVLKNDAKSLQARLPAAQKDKMTAALEAIFELEKGLTNGTAGGPVAAPVQCKDTGKIQQSVMEATEEKQQQARVIANSFACDVSRIAVWKLCASADGSTPFGGFHNTSHQTGTDAADAKLTTIESWFATQVSYLATQLKSMRDPLGTGSVFDSTIIYWFNECRHGNHDPGNLPLVILGSGGGKIETGRQLMVEKPFGQKYGNLLVSLAHAMGDTSIKTFGDANNCTGPLPGLLKPGISPA